MVSSCSLISASSSRPISLYKRISSMAFACFSVKLSWEAITFDSLERNFIPVVFPSVRQAFAMALSLEPRRISITRSITLQALINPSWISFRSLSFSRRVVYFLAATWNWKSTLYLIICLSPITSGLPSAMASIFTPKVSSRRVFLYSILTKLSASASLRSSITIRMPSLEDWLEISTISGAFLLSARAATSIRNLAMFAPIME